VKVPSSRIRFGAVSRTKRRQEAAFDTPDHHLRETVVFARVSAASRSKKLVRPSRVLGRRSPATCSLTMKAIGRRGYPFSGPPFRSARPINTQPLWPPRPMAFESATSTLASRASFGT
jgi:hypothetical protein